MADEEICLSRLCLKTIAYCIDRYVDYSIDACTALYVIGDPFDCLTTENRNDLLKFLAGSNRLRGPHLGWIVDHNLTHLDLGHSPSLVTHSAMKLISNRCKLLKYLNIKGSAINGEKLASCLTTLSSLSHLDVSSCSGIGSEFTSASAQFPFHLKSLSIKDCHRILSDDIGFFLSQPCCKSIRKLDLANTFVTDECVGFAVLTLTSLEWLSLSFCQHVTDPWQFVSWELRLRRIDLSFNSIRDAAIGLLCRKAVHLKSVNLSGPVHSKELTVTTVSHLATLVDLEELLLAHCSSLTFFAVQESLVDTGKLQWVVSLDLSAISDVDCRCFFVKCPALKRLVLDECSNIRYSSSLDLPRVAHASLEHVSLRFSTFDSRQSCLDLVASFQEVKTLHFDGSDILTDEDILGGAFEKCAQSLVKLSLAKCSQLTCKMLHFVLARMSRLRHLDIFGCSQMHRKEIEQIQKNIARQRKQVKIKWPHF